MSNTSVGGVYQRIIQDVVETSRVDFEEGGVDEGVLDELARVWQQKLSSLGVAQFPWDPKVEPPPPISNPPTVPSNYQQQAQAQKQIPQPGQQPIPQPMQPMNQPIHLPISQPPNPSQPANFQQLPQQQMPNVDDPSKRIKTEPGLEAPPSQGMSVPQFQNGMNAQQRALHQVAAQFGDRAAASITNANNAPQQQPQQPPQQPQQQPQQAQQPQQQQPSTNIGIPRPNMMAKNPSQAAYSAGVAQQMQAAQARLKNQNQTPNNGQTDGAGDEDEMMVKRFNAQGEEIEMGRIEIDNMIRRKIEAMGRDMEGGGLMLPLKEHKRTVKGKNKMGNYQALLHAQVNESAFSKLPPQMDGPDDDDDDKEGILKEEDGELDEDAINSDLDDPDDGLNDEEDDDEGMGHIMLCMYDKVQRVKNKWKCVMKDGVLTVNGKEYVFHKASGEYEW